MTNSTEPPVLSPADDLHTARELENAVILARGELKTQQAAWCEFYVTGGRFNATEASRRARVSPSTGYNWRDLDSCRRYCAALVRREAGKVILGGEMILRELAFIAMTNPADMFEIVTEAQAAADERWYKPLVSAHLTDDQGDEGPNLDGSDIQANGGEAEEGESEPRQVIRLRSITDLPQHMARSIASIEFEDGVPTKIKFHDKVRALQLLGSAFNLFDGDRAIDDRQPPWTGFRITPPAETEPGDQT